MVERARAQKRLSRDDWVKAASEELLSEGFSTLRVERVARRLGVTPGSFYWHFRSRDELRDRMLRSWRDNGLREASAAMQRLGTGPEQVRGLPDVLMSRRLPEYDEAMRRWALRDPAVARAVASADDLRIGVVTAMFNRCGLAPAQAEQRARILWGFARGSLGSKAPDRMRDLRALIETLLHDVGE